MGVRRTPKIDDRPQESLTNREQRVPTLSKCQSPHCPRTGTIDCRPTVPPFLLTGWLNGIQEEKGGRAHFFSQNVSRTLLPGEFYAEPIGSRSTCPRSSPIVCVHRPSGQRPGGVVSKCYLASMHDFRIDVSLASDRPHIEFIPHPAALIPEENKGPHQCAGLIFLRKSGAAGRIRACDPLVRRKNGDG